VRPAPTTKSLWFTAVCLLPRLSHCCQKRYHSADNEKHDALYYAKRIGQLAHAAAGNYDCGTRLQEKCAVSNYAADGGKRDSKNDRDGSH
jgi:hypothetical protein